MSEDDKYIDAIELFINGITQSREHSGDLEKTPVRALLGYREILSGYQHNATDVIREAKYHANGYHHDMVTLMNMPVVSMCKHHILPFIGTAHVGYIPNQHIVGVSKIARCVDILSRRLQIQESLTKEIADAMESTLETHGVIVHIVAEHMCMKMRGVKTEQCKMITTHKRGMFRQDNALCQEFISMMRNVDMG